MVPFSTCTSDGNFAQIYNLADDYLIVFSYMTLGPEDPHLRNSRFGGHVTTPTLQYLWPRPPGAWMGGPGYKPGTAGGDSGRPPIDQSHRYGHHQAACCEPARSYDKTTRTAICFEHKTQYLLIRAPYTRIVVFCHISNIPPMISQSQISCWNFFVKQVY